MKLGICDTRASCDITVEDTPQAREQLELRAPSVGQLASVTTDSALPHGLLPSPPWPLSPGEMPTSLRLCKQPRQLLCSCGLFLQPC